MKPKPLHFACIIWIYSPYALSLIAASTASTPSLIFNKVQYASENYFFCIFETRPYKETKYRYENTQN